MHKSDSRSPLIIVQEEDQPSRMKDFAIGGFTLLVTLTFTLLYSSVLALTIEEAQEWNAEEIHGYHFHTYFFQDNLNSRDEALVFR